MSRYPEILPSAQAEFPKSANKQVQVIHAWHPDKSSTGKSHPEQQGNDGWESINGRATRHFVQSLADRGYRWVTLYTGGTANSRKDVPISRLIYVP